MIFEGLKRTAGTFRRELKVYQAVRADPRTPRRARILIGLAVAYFISPIDLVPDFIPVIGHLDDALIVPLLVYLAMRSVPAAVLADARAMVAAASTGQSDEALSRPVGTPGDLFPPT